MKPREIILTCAMAFAAIALSGFISLALVGPSGLPFLVASMGAAAVLVFAMPQSPVSQPFPVIVGHLVAATLGVACAKTIGDPVLASAAAVALAIGGMIALRCTHPPGGAAALGAVVGGPAIHDLGWLYVLIPVAMNAIILVILAIVFNRVAKFARYPLGAPPQKVSTQDWALGPAQLNRDDVRAALAEEKTVIDIDEDELHRLYQRALLYASKRRVGHVTANEIMTRNPFVLRPEETLETAWAALRKAKVKAAPVVDPAHRVIGILTMSDFLRAVSDLTGESLDERMAAFLHTENGQPTRKVENLMSHPVKSVPFNTHIVDLIALFADGGFHHLPIVSERAQLVGIVTRTDLMRALALALVRGASGPRT